MSIPVRSLTIVWKLSSASRRPWEISGWYGVYAVYQAGFSSTLRRMTPRRDRVGVPETDQRAEDLVAVGEGADRVERLDLVERRSGRPSGLRVRMLSGHDEVDELVGRREAERRRASPVPHSGIGPDVTVGEPAGASGLRTGSAAMAPPGSSATGHSLVPTLSRYLRDGPEPNVGAPYKRRG